MASRRAVALLLALWGMCASGADVVQTLAGRMEGLTQLKAEHLAVGGQAVAWDQVVYVVRESAGRTLRSPETVRLTSGEAWSADILRLSAKKLGVRFGLFGPREVSQSLLAALEFVPHLPLDGQVKANTLYREDAEPIPGSLLWVDEKRIAMDSPLGVLTVPRQGVTRYVFGKGPVLPPRPNEDEVGLTDGTVLRGTLKAGADLLDLEHAVLGKLSIPAPAVRFLLRHPAPVVYLAELARPAVDAAPLIAQRAEPEMAVYGTEAGSGREAAGAVRGLRIWPKCTVRYELARPAGKKVVFRTTVGPVEGARGDVRVRIAAAGKALFEKEFTPEDRAESLSLEVPEGNQLVFEVDFGSRLRFPCGAAFGEPHVIIGQ